MFENYFNNSIPDNINYCDTNLNCNYDLPCETPSENDGISSYYWYYGDTVNLEFDITGEIRVETNAIVYSITGASPTSITYGTIGRKACKKCGAKLAEDSKFCSNCGEKTE